jgi:hypothetical protein
MQHTPVDSAMLKSYAFDKEAKVIEVMFPSGKTYRYPCSEETHAGFLAAESKGKFFNQHIRPGGVLPPEPQQA